MKTEIYVDGTYEKSSPNWHAEDSQWKAIQVVQTIQSNGLRPQRLADIGCGVGGVLDGIAGSLPGCNLYGYDISQHAIEVANAKRSDIHYTVATLENVDNYFDVILALDVIEHVEDPFQFLRTMRLKADYKLLHIPLDISVSTVVRDRLTTMRRVIGHIHYFTLQTALALLSDCEYQIVDWRFTPTYQLINDQMTVARKCAQRMRRVLMRVSPEWTAVWVGGCSIMVLAK
jgi:SAM-dependent methyltransferase